MRNYNAESKYLVKKKIRVLIADDSALMRKLIKNVLSKDPQIEVVGFARDGLEAIKRVIEFAPDVLVLDIEMPKMNGLEFARQVLAENPDFPIIIISAYVEKYSMDYITQIGIKNILRKPINLLELARHIKELTNHKE